MKLIYTSLVTILATTCFANAAEVKPLDLNALAPDSQAILQGLVPDHANIADHKGDKGDKGNKADPGKKMETPKACTDAAITEDQKAKIESAVYDYERAKIQNTADAKLAMMDYAHTAMDATTDKAAADSAAGKIVASVHKLTESHLALGTQILFEIVTPEQRKNTFMCMMAMHKMHRGQKGHH